MRARDRLLLRPRRGVGHATLTPATSTWTGCATRTSTSTTRPTSTSATSGCSPTSLAPMPDGPLDALHIGGGGFSFPRYLDAVRPGTKNRVLEIDGELVKIAKARARARRVEGPAWSTSATPGSRSGTSLTDSYDLVVGDAFAGESVPWHLTTAGGRRRSSTGSCGRAGIVMMNVIDGDHSRFARAELATLRPQFRHVAVDRPAGRRPEGHPGEPGARSRRRRRSPASRSIRPTESSSRAVTSTATSTTHGCSPTTTPPSTSSCCRSDERTARLEFILSAPDVERAARRAGPRSRSSVARTSASPRCSTRSPGARSWRWSRTPRADPAPQLLRARRTPTRPSSTARATATPTSRSRPARSWQPMIEGYLLDGSTLEMVAAPGRRRDRPDRSPTCRCSTGSAPTRLPHSVIATKHDKVKASQAGQAQAGPRRRAACSTPATSCGSARRRTPASPGSGTSCRLWLS